MESSMKFFKLIIFFCALMQLNVLCAMQALRASFGQIRAGFVRQSSVLKRALAPKAFAAAEPVIKSFSKEAWFRPLAPIFAPIRSSYKAVVYQMSRIKNSYVRPSAIFSGLMYVGCVLRLKMRSVHCVAHCAADAEKELYQKIESGDKTGLSGALINNYMRMIDHDRHENLYKAVVSQFWFWDLYTWTLKYFFYALDPIHQKLIAHYALEIQSIEGITPQDLCARKKLLRQYL